MIIQDQVAAGQSFTFVVNEDSHGMRADVYIAQQFLLYSRSFIKQLIDQNNVLVNQVILNKAGVLLKMHDVVMVTFPPEHIVEQEVIKRITADISIVEKNPHFMIVYKPANIMVHPPSQTSTAITVIDWILQNHADIGHVGAVDRPGIVHRLDKDTSGIMIITRTNYAHAYFSNLFKERTIQKTYHALVHGHPDKEGTVNLAIGRNPFDRSKMTTFDADNHQELIQKHSIKIRTAFTAYKVLRYFDTMSLVEVQPKTGRTHQIRVHMKAIGHPVVGDTVYGDASSLINRQALHAFSLAFTFDNINYFFSKDMPSDMQSLIDQL